MCSHALQHGGWGRDRSRISLRRSKENMSMTESDDAKFTELFEVIRSYSRRGYDHQDKALQIIAGTYVFMFEQEEMPDVRPIVDEILEEYDYIFTTLERGRRGAGLPLQRRIHGVGLEPTRTHPGEPPPPLAGRRELPRLRRRRCGRDPGPREHRRRLRAGGDSRGDERSLARGDDLGHEAAQEAAGVRLFDAGDLFRGSCRNDLASRVAALGAEVDNVVCGPDHI